MSVSLELLNVKHRESFVPAVNRSQELFEQWVAPADSVERFEQMLSKVGPSFISYVLKTDTGELAGCINLSEIVSGCFHSAYLGYYAFMPHNNKGLMKQGLGQLIQIAFSEHGLHRLEANIQPENVASKKLVESLGFRLEGFSPKYLHIAGEWRDHDRYALTQEDLRSGN